ncbi:glutamine--fructose-6-phosphate aminotransferase [isomerizing] 2 [Hydra vulgaris]|uniref:glutamine--fructose-6-phosphate aminotransferase [isomerizing] 2 n=1 Tax=Hydra vulgaris TaxID=6087 RepID=UPI001F5E60F9|nr:glutamine--fructose-6-phosphate aminotransferase [isomerizing] 2-like [Hydra vulgaris]XP_047134084.1 glutamine--fructose-6-phosphate aminotransferase [isomerizing] 2-like [Hydra vulgaris]
METSLFINEHQPNSWKDVNSSLYEGLEFIARNKQQHLQFTKVVNCSLSESKDNKNVDATIPTLMEKEIFEQPQSIQQSMLGRVDFDNFKIHLNGIETFLNDLLRCRRIILVGAGSSFHVALACRQLMEELLDLPVFVETSSDLLDREVPIFRDDVCIFISQSGETSDVLNACKYCKKKEALLMGITNEENSTLSAETHFGINLNAGNEVGVTSTKTYTSQFIVLTMFSLKMAEDKRSKQKRVQEIISEMKTIPDKVITVLKLNNYLKDLAQKYVNCKSLLVMGRGFQQATCLEGSFKFKEVVNIHSEGIHSGELKHGPLALIDENMPIIMIIMRDAIYEKCINAFQQVKARGGKPIVICEEDDETTKNMVDISICIPKTSDCLMGILAIIPFQLLSLHLAVLKGKNADEPQHLKKTITDDA